jgi:hypothetical protein
VWRTRISSFFIILLSDPGRLWPARAFSRLPAASFAVGVETCRVLSGETAGDETYSQWRNRSIERRSLSVAGTRSGATASSVKHATMHMRRIRFSFVELSEWKGSWQRVPRMELATLRTTKPIDARLS